MDRRSFLVGLAGGLGIGGLALAGCGEDGDGGGEGTGGASSGPACAAQVMANHGHTLVVPRADVDRGAARTYDIRGSSGHGHTVEVTAADFEALAAGEEVRLLSSTTSGHEHPVRLTCPSETPA